MSNCVIENGIKKRVVKTFFQTLFALALLSLIWIISHQIVGNELLIPNFFTCVKETVRLLCSSGFWISFSATLLRVVIAFFISFILAAVLAIASYIFSSLKKIFAPFVSFLRSIPTLAVLLIILVWSGASVAPIVVACLSLFPMLYTGILSALFSTDEKLLEMSRVYKVPLKKQIFSLYIPSALPYVLREVGAALAFSLKLVVSAEVLASTYNSLGGLMQEAKLFMEMPTLFALITVTFCMGLIFELLGETTSVFVERRSK